MYALLVFTKVLPENIDRVKTFFNQQHLPVIRQQKGLFNIFWLEPTDKVEDFILVTQWQNKEYAEAFQNSTLYNELMNQTKDLIVKEPIVKSYYFEKVMEEVPELVK